MTPERFGELLRRPQLLDGQNAIELEELIAAHPWCGPLRVLRYRKAVLEEADDLPHWRARAEPFLPKGAVRTQERKLQASYPGRAEAHFAFEGARDAPPASTPVVAAPFLPSLDYLPECTLAGAAAVDTVDWYLHRNGHIMEIGRPRPTPIEELDSYKRWKRRRVRTSWNDLLALGIARDTAKKKKKKRKNGPPPAASPEVASETLAGLLAAQGHHARAIEMYEQLALRYPAKSATFAARIADLQLKDA